MKSIIIRNRAEIAESECLAYLNVVIAKGRISDDGKCYCYATRFRDGIVVVARRTKDSDIFDIVMEATNEPD